MGHTFLWVVEQGPMHHSYPQCVFPDPIAQSPVNFFPPGPESVVAIFQLAEQPGTGVGPPGVGRAGRDVQGRGGLEDA
jgi:hypothetical protein